MRILAAALAALLALPTGAGAAGERLTARCYSNWGTGEVMVLAPRTTLQLLLDLVANPATDADLYHRLWRPSSARLIDYSAFDDEVMLTFDRVQDTDEIGRSLRSDPRLAGLGVTRAEANTRDVCGVPPPLSRVTVTEYFNRLTNHYFLSSSSGENAAIDSGAAGPGWERTGETFDASAAAPCGGPPPVFRFYTRGANSHFFTADPGECGFLRNNDPGWLFEGEAFGARVPASGTCAANHTSIYRLYNNRWMHNDSNHRFVKRFDLYQQMQAQGWAGEGVAMCLVNPPS